MFEQKIRCARVADTPAKAALHYQEALGIYRGDLLDDVILVCQDDYYLREQERLRGQYLTVMEEYAVLEEKRQHDEIAEELYGRILTFDPCHESACHRLMALLLRAGNRTRALSHFVQLSEAMQRDLDTCPGWEMVQLYEAARLNDEEFAIKNS
jgi:DNA-binding SARP family transcriptional activator